MGWGSSRSQQNGSIQSPVVRRPHVIQVTQSLQPDGQALMFRLWTFISVCMVAAECARSIALVWAFSLPQGAWVLQCKTVNPPDFWWLLIMYSLPASCPKKNSPDLPSRIVPLSLLVHSCSSSRMLEQFLNFSASLPRDKQNLTTAFVHHFLRTTPSNLALLSSLTCQSRGLFGA